MLKLSSKYLLAISVFNFFSYAVAKPYQCKEKIYYGHEEFTDYDHEGNMLFKLRGFGMTTTSTIKGLPTSIVAAPQSLGKIYTSGIGGDAGTTIFLNDYSAVELSGGFLYFKPHTTSLARVANNYKGTIHGKAKPTYMFPLSLTAQYHIAPYGGIQPYLGIGYHGTYILSKSKTMTIRHSHGPILQAGVDLVANDYTLINLDIRQMWLEPKITLKPDLVGSSISGKIKINPILFSIGLGFKF